MNPQPPQAFSELAALLFFMMVVAFAIKAFRDGPHINLNNADLFDIGYIEGQHVKPAAAAFESQQLYLDCIDALYTLGYKRAEAKKKAKLVFSTFDPQPQTVQEFLMIALPNNP